MEDGRAVGIVSIGDLAQARDENCCAWDSNSFAEAGWSC
jgi:hypothetical protein